MGGGGVSERVREIHTDRQTETVRRDGEREREERERERERDTDRQADRQKQ